MSTQRRRSRSGSRGSKGKKKDVERQASSTSLRRLSLGSSLGSALQSNVLKRASVRFSGQFRPLSLKDVDLDALRRQVSRQASMQIRVPDTPEPQAQLDQLLRDPVGAEKFGDFLASEFCEENVEFLLAVIALNNDDKDDPNYIAFDDLINTYVKAGSDHEINLSAECRNHVMREVEAGNTKPEILDPAVEEIRVFIELDNFPRFLDSKFFKEYEKESPEMAKRVKG